MSLLKCGAWGLIVALSTSSPGAAAQTQPTLSVGQFVLSSAANHALIYRDVCVSKFPAMRLQFDRAAASFRRRYDESVAPLVTQYETNIPFNTPVPPSWIVKLTRDEDALRDNLADVDPDSCESFLSILRDLDVSELRTQVESTLMQLSKVPPEQLKGG